MIFNKNKLLPKIELKINGNIIDEVTTFTFLGIVFNSKLTWIDHTNILKMKLSRSISTIKKSQYRTKSIRIL